MTISVTEEKFAKIFSLLPEILPEKMKRKDLESIVGILMWISQVVPHLKSSLATLYHDCAQGSVSAKFVQPNLLHDVRAACLDNPAMPKGQRFQHATLDGVVNIELTSYASHVSHVVHIYVPMQHLRTMGMVTQSIAMHDTMLATCYFEPKS